MGDKDNDDVMIHKICLRCQEVPGKELLVLLGESGEAFPRREHTLPKESMPRRQELEREEAGVCGARWAEEPWDAGRRALGLPERFWEGAWRRTTKGGKTWNRGIFQEVQGTGVFAYFI